MKQAVSVITVVALGLLAGCASKATLTSGPHTGLLDREAYRSKVTLTSGSHTGLYDVAFLLEDVSDPGNPIVLSAPRISTYKHLGHCTMTVTNDSGGFIFTALIGDTSGKPEAQTTASVLKDRKVIWSDKQTVPMSK